MELVRNRKLIPVIILSAMLLALGAGLVWRLQAAGVSLTAQSIGYVDSTRLINAYLATPAVDKVLQDEKSRLEKEMATVLDKEKDDQKKQEIVNQYQAKLNARIQQEVEKLNTFVAQVAKEKGISVVLDGAAVIYGGVDLTADVMKKAGISTSSPTAANTPSNTSTNTSSK